MISLQALVSQTGEVLERLSAKIDVLKAWSECSVEVADLKQELVKLQMVLLSGVSASLPSGLKPDIADPSTAFAQDCQIFRNSFPDSVLLHDEAVAYLCCRRCRSHPVSHRMEAEFAQLFAWHASCASAPKILELFGAELQSLNYSYTLLATKQDGRPVYRNDRDPNLYIHYSAAQTKWLLGSSGPPTWGGTYFVGVASQSWSPLEISRSHPTLQILEVDVDRSLVDTPQSVIVSGVYHNGMCPCGVCTTCRGHSCYINGYYERQAETRCGRPVYLKNIIKYSKDCYSGRSGGTWQSSTVGIATLYFSGVAWTLEVTPQQHPEQRMQSRRHSGTVGPQAIVTQTIVVSSPTRQVSPAGLQWTRLVEVMDLRQCVERAARYPAEFALPTGAVAKRLQDPSGNLYLYDGYPVFVIPSLSSPSEPASERCVHRHRGGWTVSDLPSGELLKACCCEADHDYRDYSDEIYRRCRCHDDGYFASHRLTAE